MPGIIRSIDIGRKMRILEIGRKNFAEVLIENKVLKPFGLQDNSEAQQLKENFGVVVGVLGKDKVGQAALIVGGRALGNAIGYGNNKLFSMFD